MSSSVTIEKASARHREEFVAAAKRSRKLCRPWAYLPETREEFARYLSRFRGDQSFGWMLIDGDRGELVGAINLTNIVRGMFQSGFLGYCVFSPFQRRGYMSAGMRLVLREAFGQLRLHRVEANIQPENTASIELVRGLGFRYEGLAKRYLKVGGRWRDHEHWAMIREDWRAKAMSS